MTLGRFHLKALSVWLEWALKSLRLGMVRQVMELVEYRVSIRATSLEAVNYSAKSSTMWQHRTHLLEPTMATSMPLCNG